MRKFYFISAITALSLAGCSSDEYLGGEGPNSPENPTQGKAIAFGGKSFATTRADHEGADAAGLLGDNFVVMGVKGDGTTRTTVFDHYNVNYKASTANTTESNTKDWEYVGLDPHANSSTTGKQTIKYWDYSTKQYDYVAFSYGTATKANVTYTKIDPSKLGTSDAVYTVTGTAAELTKTYVADLVTLYNSNGLDQYNTTVTPKFRSLGTKVRMAFYETIPGYSVKDVKFYTDATSTTPAAAPTLFTATAVLPSGEGTMTVTYPTVGYSNIEESDYNKAHVTFEQKSGVAAASTLDFTELTYTAGKLGETSATASYVDNKAYTVILPNEAGANLQLRIKYTLVSNDGSAEEIVVDNATAVVPAAYAQWKPNYAYTYIFKISDKTNGSTGTKLVPNPNFDPDQPEDPTNPKYIEEVVEGLTPITFDAVVVDTEEGIQETITTVSTPSITTYQEGAVVTANDEYKAGDIYTTVDNVTLTATNCGYYEATTTGAEITEAIVKDQLDGKVSGTGITLSPKGVTIVDEIPGVDGNKISVNAAKLDIYSGKTYVFNYTDGSQNYVKIIKVQ